MKIVILAPSDKSFIKEFLPNQNFEKLPLGYSGAPFIGTLIQELLLLDHSVIAITTSMAINNNYEIQQFTYKNFTWVVVPSRPSSINMNGRKLGRILDFFALEQKNMLKSLMDFSPDIVHAHWSYEFAGVAIKSGFPFLITIHDNPFVIFKYFKNLYRFGRLIMAEKNLKKVIYASTVSPYMLEYATERCTEVRVIPNPIQIRFTLDQIIHNVEIKSKSLYAPRIIMINNGWDQRKNGKKALMAFKIIQKKTPDASLHLFGGGSEVNGLANKETMKLGIDNVFFNGTVSHEKLFVALKESHLLLHPALEESFGVVLIEAMSMGVPVIGGLNSGAVPWVIKEQQLLVDVTNEDIIADKLFEIINDATLYKTKSIEGFHNVVNRFSSSIVTKEYLNYYEHILANK